MPLVADHVTAASYHAPKTISMNPLPQVAKGSPRVGEVRLGFIKLSVQQIKA